MKVAHLGRTKNPTRRTVAKNRLNIDLCYSPDVSCSEQCAKSCNEGFWNRQTTWRIEANVDAFIPFSFQATRNKNAWAKNEERFLQVAFFRTKKSVTEEKRHTVTLLSHALEKNVTFLRAKKSLCVFSENPRPRQYMCTVCCTFYT